MTAARKRSTIAMVAVEDDEQLYRRWANGERSAGERLIERHLDTVGRFLANKAPDPSRLEDLVATVFEKCAKGLGAFEGRSSFRTYLLGIAYNVLRDELKRHTRAPSLDETVTSLASVSDSPSAVVSAREEQALLLQALRELPVALQVILELHFFEDLSRSEVARLLGVPEGTAASRLRRAKVELERVLESLSADPAALRSTLTKLDDWVAQLRSRLGLDRGPADRG